MRRPTVTAAPCLPFLPYPVRRCHYIDAFELSITSPSPNPTARTPGQKYFSRPSRIPRLPQWRKRLRALCPLI
ncbi:hypothetical protein Cob_v003600 [Colletotrichum orbiculare MAFF 240422]|uniref:Uncharacterized protein n=1 Tax=Colletotrichum orbiculare (strain 104-T / ATCC 96160 / CBS 514.97 / LARS 414 / MAFF 240422) TaxID=1213857 RepID=A0A484FZK7_COLOR|nr:hypothetical protein Cob_v003600 [Colletotrichum orbiculare MAFF 240422]